MWNLARRLILPTIVVVVLIVLARAATHYTSLEVLVRYDTALRDAIRTSPFLSFTVAFVAYAVLSMIPGTAGKSIVLGWFYGLLAGVLLVNMALVLAAIITFVVIRHLFHARVSRRLGTRLQALRDHMQNDGAFYLVTLRMAHAPFTLMNYTAAAATDIPLRTFWWTTQIGLLPGNIVFVFAGTRLPTLNDLVQHGPWGVLDGPMIAALLSTVFVPWMLRRVFHLGMPKPDSVRQLR